jgi:tRNA(fMet)-specific endonuclease VapC
LDVFEKFKQYSLGEIGISSITLAELHFGIKKSNQPEKNLNALNQFILPLEVFEFDTNAAIEYGTIRSNLEKKGTPIGALDTLIAAHVKSLNFTLVTNSVKEFKRIEDIKIENWVD